MNYQQTSIIIKLSVCICKILLVKFQRFVANFMWYIFVFIYCPAMLIASLVNHSLSSKEHISLHETSMGDRIGVVTAKMPYSWDKANHQQCSTSLTTVTIMMHIIQTYNTLVCNSFVCQTLDSTPDICLMQLWSTQKQIPIKLSGSTSYIIKCNMIIICSYIIRVICKENVLYLVIMCIAVD